MTTTDQATTLVDGGFARELLDQSSLDVVVATSPANVHLIGGYSTWLDEQLRTWMVSPEGGDDYRAGFAFLSRGGHVTAGVSPLFFTEAELLGTADHLVALPLVRSNVQDETGTLIEALVAQGLDDARIGVELDGVSLAWMSELRAALPAAKIVDASTLLRVLRSRKSPEALRRLREVADVTEQSLRVLCDERPAFELWRNRFRLELASRSADLDHIVYGLSSGDLGQYVSSGGRAAGIYVDGGARKNGFVSDTGITLATREDARLIGRYDAALEALQAGAAALCPGSRASAAWLAMNEIASRHPGMRAQGHGIGLAIRELPLVSAPREARRSDETIDEHADMRIAAGQVINLEVAQFFPDGDSIQIEQSYVIDGTGAVPLVDADRDAPWGYRVAS